MKYQILFLLFLTIIACTSTQKIASYRNAEFSNSNNYETFKFWRELDIHRFKNNLLNIKVSIIPENVPISDINNRSYLHSACDSIQSKVEERENAFTKFKEEYFDTTDQERDRTFKHLKSDSTDILLLSKIEDDPYFDLYRDLVRRTTSALQQTIFYKSQRHFEDYVLNRSFITWKGQYLNEIFGSETIALDKISDKNWERFEENHLTYLILFSISFGTDYSEEARERIGSERLLLKLIDVNNRELITISEITHFWGNYLED